jgi:HEAT repeat protein
MTRRAAWAVAGALVAASVPAQAQFDPMRSSATPPTPSTTQGHSTGGLASRAGIDLALRLLRSSDPDDRLRGIERAATVETQEALTLLVRVAGSSAPAGPETGVARNDPRALLAVVRALAARVDHEPARGALASLLAAPALSLEARSGSPSRRDPARDEIEGAARVALARQEAAIALARSGDTLAQESLVAIARSGGSGQAAAIEALETVPPASPLVLGGVTLTTRGTVALAANIGDLRTLDAILGDLQASDAGLRAGAFAALATAGDMRAAEPARAALHDGESRVRAAATLALVRLGTPDAGAAVEALIADDATAAEGLRLARDVQSDGVTKAAAARAAASSDPSLRAAALAALGRQVSPAAVAALATLAQDHNLEGDAAYALARSPSAAAAGALERMAPSAPRLVGRAYFVRRFVRGERRANLDQWLERLAAAADGRDRAVGVLALVALGSRPLAPALADPDARVRRAAAMGARPDATSRAALLARLAIERDDVTRIVLAAGMAGGDPDAVVPTLVLSERIASGGPDAPLCALAFARRADENGAGALDALLASSDPVMRGHALRGLAMSDAPDATGRLSDAYEFEAETAVRRAAIAGLAARTSDAASPSRKRTLQLAAGLDPDGSTRWMADRALRALRTAAPARSRDVAWIRLVPAEGTTVPPDATGTLVRSDGQAVPIAFDDDGYALVPGMPPGDAQLRLAPALPSYSASTQ